MITNKHREEINEFLHDCGRHVEANCSLTNHRFSLLEAVSNLVKNVEDDDMLNARTNYFSAILHLSQIGYVNDLTTDYDEDYESEFADQIYEEENGDD